MVVELRVLGPVELHAGGRVLGAGRPQQQVLLAALAADAGRVVSAEALAFRISGQALSKQASQLLHTHITRIRRMLEQGQAADGDRVRLVRYARGYTLEIPPQQVDLHQFDSLVRQARLGNHPAHERVGVLQEALDLWRGEPLAGLSGSWVETTRQIWVKQRLAVVIAWAQSVLETGDAPIAVGPLLRELAEHQLVEPLVAVLMRALAATGRAAEALEYYAATRQRLADELGTEPGAELQAVHLAVLRGELAAPVRTAVPAQIPADVRAFTGRAAELDALGKLCPAASADPTEARIIALSGTAGVGKSALAINWAHRVADRFPDGQLYVDLRGFAPEQPTPPGEALAAILAGLGVTGAAVPAETEARASVYRREVARRRMLILLDNAASSEQVRPLLPGTGTCAVLVTSRDSLAGLVAVDGAHRLNLDLLPGEDALALMRVLIGARAEQEPAAAAALVQRCARLPLAIRVAAELVASRPASTLADMVEELADQQERLSLLEAGGDPRAAVSAVFSWSVRHLHADTALVFRSLGAHPGDDFDGYAVAALTGRTLDATRRTLEQLAHAHLIHPTAPGRYAMHDLLRAYAVRLCRTQDQEPDRLAGLGRLFTYYLATATAAVDRLYPDEAPRLSVALPAVAALPHFTDGEAARRWLDTERACLVASAVHAAAHGPPSYVIAMAAVIGPYLDASGHHADAHTIHTHGHDAARRAGDVPGEADALRAIAMAQMRLGRLRVAH